MENLYFSHSSAGEDNEALFNYARCVEFKGPHDGPSETQLRLGAVHPRDPQEELQLIPEAWAMCLTGVDPHPGPPWAVLGPPFPTVASEPGVTPLRPVFDPLVACRDSGFSCLMLRPPVIPTHSAPPRGHLGPADVLGSYGMWRRLCETARGLGSGTPDTEALASFFTRVIRSLAVDCPDLPFTAAVSLAVEEWSKISVYERQQYYAMGQMLMDLDAQMQRHGGAIHQRQRQATSSSARSPSGHVRKTCRRSAKAAREQAVPDLAERALTEYSQVMDALGSKVNDGSEVTAADEEDECALQLDLMFQHCGVSTEADLDLDYINSLLSTDQNLTDILEENSPDIPSVIRPVSGCSGWTVPDAQTPPSLTPPQDPMIPSGVRTPASVRLQDNTFQTLTEVQSSQARIHPAFQDFGPGGDVNSSGQKHQTEVDPTVQSHHATSTHPLSPGGTEQDGEENMEVGRKTEDIGHAVEERNMDSGIPNDSQRKRNNKAETQTNIKENNANRRDEKQKRRKTRSFPKPDRKTAGETRDGRRRSGTATKHGERETDLISEKQRIKRQTRPRRSK